MSNDKVSKKIDNVKSLLNDALRALNIVVDGSAPVAIQKQLVNAQLAKNPDLQVPLEIALAVIREACEARAFSMEDTDTGLSLKLQRVRPKLANLYQSYMDLGQRCGDMVSKLNRGDIIPSEELHEVYEDLDAFVRDDNRMESRRSLGKAAVYGTAVLGLSIASHLTDPLSMPNVITNTLTLAGIAEMATSMANARHVNDRS